MAAPWRGGSGHWGASIRILTGPASWAAARGVDYLSGNPGRIVGRQPGDKAGCIFGLAPASLRLMSKHGFIYLLSCVASIGRARIDSIDRDAARDEVR